MLKHFTDSLGEEFNNNPTLAAIYAAMLSASNNGIDIPLGNPNVISANRLAALKGNLENSTSIGESLLLIMDFYGYNGNQVTVKSLEIHPKGESLSKSIVNEMINLPKGTIRWLPKHLLRLCDVLKVKPEVMVELLKIGPKNDVNLDSLLRAMKALITKNQYPNVNRKYIVDGEEA